MFLLQLLEPKLQPTKMDVKQTTNTKPLSVVTSLTPILQYRIYYIQYFSHQMKNLFFVCQFSFII